MKRALAVIGIAMFIVGCQDLNLKTRDELRGDNSDGPRPASTQAAPGKPVEVASTPPDKGEEVDAQMRQLNGRVDEVENQMNQTNAVIQNVKDQNAKDSQAQTTRITALEDEVKKLDAEVAALTEQARKPVPPADPEAAIKDADGMVTAKKYKEAIVSYQKYRDASPKGARYGEATYKIGTCFQELGMKDEAKAFYEEVIAKFPKSKDAKAAGKRLKTLK